MDASVLDLVLCEPGIFSLLLLFSKSGNFSCADSIVVLGGALRRDSGLASIECSTRCLMIRANIHRLRIMMLEMLAVKELEKPSLGWGGFAPGQMAGNSPHLSSTHHAYLGATDTGRCTSAEQTTECNINIDSLNISPDHQAQKHHPYHYQEGRRQRPPSSSSI